MPNSRGSAALLRALDYDLKHTLRANRAVALWRLITGYRLLYGAALVGLALTALARVGSLFALRYFVDAVLLSSPRILALAPWYALGFVALALVQGSASYMAGKWANQTAEGACCRLRNYLYDHMQRLPFAFHDQNQTGDLLQRVTSDVETVRKLYAVHIASMGRMSMLLVISVIGMLLLHPRLTGYSLIVLPVVFGLSLFFFPRIEKRYAEAQAQEGRLSARRQENLSGVRVVRAFVRQAFERALTETENAEFLRRNCRVVHLNALFWPLSDLLTSGQLLVSTYWGARMVMAGDLTLGAYLAFIGLLGQLMFPIRTLGRPGTGMGHSGPYGSGQVDAGFVASPLLRLRRRLHSPGRRGAPAVCEIFRAPLRRHRATGRFSFLRHHTRKPAFRRGAGARGRGLVRRRADSAYSRRH